MNRTSGTAISRRQHIVQSVADIVGTPIGTRVMRRDYGFPFDLVDSPGHDRGILRWIAACAYALDRWEPRVKLRRAAPSTLTSDGRAVMRLDLVTTAEASPLSLSVPLRGGA